MGTDMQVETWFAEADVDKDGCVSTFEAKAFFERTGLSSKALGKIWRLVKDLSSGGGGGGSGLDKQQFADFLRLAAVVQNGIELDEETAELALQPPKEWAKVYGNPLPAALVAPMADADGTASPPGKAAAAASPPLPLRDSANDAPPIPPRPSPSHSTAPPLFTPQQQQQQQGPPPVPPRPSSTSPKPSTALSTAAPPQQQQQQPPPIPPRPARPHRPAPTIDPAAALASLSLGRSHSSRDSAAVGTQAPSPPSMLARSASASHAEPRAASRAQNQDDLLGPSTMPAESAESPLGTGQGAGVSVYQRSKPGPTRSAPVLRPGRPAPTLASQGSAGDGSVGVLSAQSSLALDPDLRLLLGTEGAALATQGSRGGDGSDDDAHTPFDAGVPESPLPQESWGGRQYGNIRSFNEMDFKPPSRSARPGFQQVPEEEESDEMPHSPSADRLRKGKSLSRSLGHNFLAASRQDHVAEGEFPVHYDARLPPLVPDRAAQLSWLAAGNGIMIAGPIGKDRPGRILQWGRPEGNLRWPAMDEALLEKQQKSEEKLYRRLLEHDIALQGVPVEDPDSSPSCNVRVAANRITALHMDEAHGIMWLGDKDGYVTGFDLMHQRGALLGDWASCQCDAMGAHCYRYKFTAHKTGAVTAICRSMAGTLWTGSERGSVRIFELGLKGGVLPGARELRRGGTAIGVMLPRAHQKRVLHILAPGDGRVMWTATMSHLCLWCALTGLYLGELTRRDMVLDLRDVRDAITPQLIQKAYQDAGKIPWKEGLVEDAGGCIASSPSLQGAEQCVRAQQELRDKFDKGFSEKATFMAVNMKNRGMQIAKTGTKGISTLFSKAKKGLLKAADAALGEDTYVPAGSGASLTGASGSAMGLGGAGARSMRGVDEDEDDETMSQSGASSAPSNDVSPEVGHILTLAAAGQGNVWVAYSKGAMDVYTPLGKHVTTVNLPSPACAISAVGQRVWVGTAAGRVYVYDSAECRLLREWAAGMTGILHIAPAGSRCYTLAADGSICGWGARLPCAMDTYSWERWKQDEGNAITHRTIKIFAVTWNVNESPPEDTPNFLQHIRKNVSTNKSYSVAMFGLQEIEMGGASVAAGVAKEVLKQKKALEKGNNTAKAWASSLLAAMNAGGQHWFQVGLRQLCGIFVVVLARVELRPCIGEVMSSYVTTGVLGGLGGNKGAVAVSFTLWRRRVTVVSSHFAAHQENLRQRNGNYRTIAEQLTFSRRLSAAGEHHALQHAASGNSPGQALDKSASAGRPAGYGGVDTSSMVDSDDELEDDPQQEELALSTEHHGKALQDSEVLVWVGDFNYRVDLEFQDALDYIKHKNVAGLVARDQCRAAMHAGETFVGLKEGDIKFLPTYKFDKPGKALPEGRRRNIHDYDSSEKQRVPSYTDRIFFKGTKPFPKPSAPSAWGDVSTPEDVDTDDSSSNGDSLMPEPVQDRDGLGDVIVSCEAYSSLMDVCESDHKPVYAVLRVEMPSWEQDKKRLLASHILKEYYKQDDPPKAELDTLGAEAWSWDTMPLDAVSSDSQGDNDDSDEEVSNSSTTDADDDDSDQGDVQRAGHAPAAASTPTAAAALGKGPVLQRELYTRRRGTSAGPREVQTLHLDFADGNGSSGRGCNRRIGHVALVNNGAMPMRYKLPLAVQHSDWEVSVQVWPASGFVPAGSSVTLAIAATGTASFIRQAKFAFEIEADTEFSEGGDWPTKQQREAQRTVLRFVVAVKPSMPEHSSGGFGKALRQAMPLNLNDI